MTDDGFWMIMTFRDDQHFSLNLLSNPALLKSKACSLFTESHCGEKLWQNYFSEQTLSLITEIFSVFVRVVKGTTIKEMYSVNFNLRWKKKMKSRSKNDAP